MLKRIALLLLAGYAPVLLAQARATASRSGDAQIGIGYSRISPDYTPHTFNAIAAYADFDFTRSLGIEAEFHYGKSPGADQVYEKTYEIGGRYFRTYNRWNPYVKLLYGRGVFNFPYDTVTLPSGKVSSVPTANLAYNLAAAGVGVDYSVTRRINLRADYEYQRWFGFPPNGLTPSLLTFGVAYHFQ